MKSLVVHVLFGPLIGLGAWMLVMGFFLAGFGIRALERLR